jgi:hypothetical protein
VPRLFIVTTPDGLLVFESLFVEALDDYDPDYSVYFLPWNEAKRLHEPWESLTEGAESRGRVPIRDVEFDDTRRFFIRTTVIDRFTNLCARDRQSLLASPLVVAGSPAVLFESERDFQLWRAVVGHSQLLFRSTKTESEPTRIDVLFKPVAALKLPTLLHGLRIRNADAGEADEIRREVDQAPTQDSKVFILESGAFEGYVVAGICVTHEDNGEYSDPSALLVD